MAQSVSDPNNIGSSLIRYDAREKIAWDIFICGVVFLCSILVPYRLLSGYDPFDAFYVFVTVVFCVDIGVVFRTTLASGRNVISDPQTVAGHYLRSWFVVDLLSALPFPMLVLLAGRDGAVPAALLPWLGGLRLVRLLSLLKVNSFFGRLPNFVNISGAALRLVVFGYWLTLVTHFIALGWLFIGAGNPEGEFFTRYLLALSVFLMLSVLTFLRAYIAGVYQLTYGRVGPTEMRVLGIVLNAMVFFFPPDQFDWLELPLTYPNILSLMWSMGGLITFSISLVNQLRALAIEDPPREH